MASWPFQEAEEQFDELVRRALEEGPQTVTRDGVDVVVVVPAVAYGASRRPWMDFKEFLRSGPDINDLDLDQQRQPRPRGD